MYAYIFLAHSHCITDFHISFIHTCDRERVGSVILNQMHIIHGLPRYVTEQLLH